MDAEQDPRDPLPGRPWLVPMAARDAAEPGRVATPLELLFDLTVVVAVAAVSAQLTHAVAAGHLGSGVLGYLMVFFAVWWAWMNFTWFASAYDSDDVPYRLLTLVQMGGVLVLAAGVPAAFTAEDFAAVTVGYVIMRAAMVLQWWRAARGDPDRRATAWGYLGGTAVVQAGWLVRLALPTEAGFVGFFVLVAAELAVPLLAERRGRLTWHPHHIAERYGLFTIIVLGECVLGTLRALEPAVSAAGLHADTVLVGAGGLVMLFAAWWLYFLRPAAGGLARRRDLSFRWGYGHYGIFASLAALGSGLEVVAQTLTHPVQVTPMVVAGSVALPLIAFMLLVWALHTSLRPPPRRGPAPVVAAVALTALVAVAGGAGLALPWAVAAMSLPIAGLVAVLVAGDHRRAVAGAG